VTERGRVRKRLKKKDGQGAGSETFIDVKSGGWPMYTPCPVRRALNPGGQTLYLRLLLLFKLFKGDYIIIINLF
jgi:hypothetical protein